MKKKILLFIIIVLLVLVSTVSGQDLENQLGSYISMDQIQVDVNILNDDFTKVNYTISGADNVPALVDYGFDFIETSADYINLSRNITDFAQNNYTFNIWSKTEGIATDAGHIINCQSGSNIMYLRMQSDGTLKFLDTDGTAKSISTVEGYDDGQWHMITITSNGTAYNLYVDAILNGSIDFNSYHTINDACYLGVSTALGEEYNGTMDELGIWNRTLDSEEITFLYDNPGYESIGGFYKNFSFIPEVIINQNNNFKTVIEYNTSLISNITSTDLIYNNINYETSQNIISDNLSEFDVNIAAPSIADSYTFYYNTTFRYVNNSVGNTQSRINTQNVVDLILGICNATLSDPVYINYTFQDELTLNKINASITASEFIYSLSSNYANSKSFTYTNTTENPSTALCISPSYAEVYVAQSIPYQSTGYDQRIYSQSSLLTNTTNNVILYLMSSNDGSFITFQVVDPANNPITNVFSNVSRQLEGQTTLIESGLTDDAGLITYFLSPLITYTFYFEVEGYTPVTTSLKPTQSEYTITLGQQQLFNSTNLYQGIQYSIRPQNLTLKNNTVYNFVFELTSGYWQLDSAGFNLKNDSNDLIGSSSCSVITGCTSQDAINTGINATQLTMEYYWVINGTKVNGTRVWAIAQGDIDNSAFAWLKSDLGKFGDVLSPLTRILISMLIILTGVGFLTNLTGQQSVGAIIFYAFGVTAFLDIIGLIPAVGRVDNFVTIIFGLIVFGYFAADALRITSI